MKAASLRRILQMCHGRRRKNETVGNVPRNVLDEPNLDFNHMRILGEATEDQEGILVRPCVDCGRVTGNYCENEECTAAHWIPSEKWREAQVTPHCSMCAAKYLVCHFCRGVRWVTPPPPSSYQSKWNIIKTNKSFGNGIGVDETLSIGQMLTLEVS